MVKVYTALTILKILDLYKCNNTLNKGCIRTLRLTYYSIISDLVAYKLRLNMVIKKTYMYAIPSFNGHNTVIIQHF